MAEPPIRQSANPPIHTSNGCGIHEILYIYELLRIIYDELRNHSGRQTPISHLRNGREQEGGHDGGAMQRWVASERPRASCNAHLGILLVGRRHSFIISSTFYSELRVKYLSGFLAIYPRLPPTNPNDGAALFRQESYPGGHARCLHAYLQHPAPARFHR